MSRKKTNEIGKVQVRVLRQHGEFSPDSVIELDADVLETLLADGAVDADPHAVAYALSLQ